jgi:hypothetical protein
LAYPVDRGQHRRDQHGCGEGRLQSDREQCPAARLGGAGRDRIRLTRTQTEVLESLRRGVEAGAVEPAKQLLHSVPDEQPAHNHPQNQSPDLHLSEPPLVMCS